jgi:hypothetical protein
MSASPDAQARIDRALQQIEAAQALLGRACAELSTLCHGASAWQRCSKLYDQVHAFWYRVRSLPDGRHHITTDSEPETRPAGEGG